MSWLKWVPFYASSSLYLTEDGRVTDATLYIRIAHQPKLVRPWVIMYKWDCVTNDNGPACYPEGRYATKEEAVAVATAQYRLGYMGKHKQPNH